MVPSYRPRTRARATSAPVSTPAGSVSIPADGATLRSFGYTFGPVEQLSLPRSAVISAAVDQANNVTAVLSAPPAGEVAAYLRRALPAAGFSITDDDRSRTDPHLYRPRLAGQFHR